jgi:hypothetical protein
MNQTEWAAIAVAVTTLVAAFSGAVRFLVKHYLSELKPNSGKSMNDRLTMVEYKVEKIYEILLSDRLGK